MHATQIFCFTSWLVVVLCRRLCSTWLARERFASCSRYLVMMTSSADWWSLNDCRSSMFSDCRSRILLFSCLAVNRRTRISTAPLTSHEQWHLISIARQNEIWEDSRRKNSHNFSRQVFCVKNIGNKNNHLNKRGKSTNFSPNKTNPPLFPDQTVCFPPSLRYNLFFRILLIHILDFTGGKASLQ